MLSGVFEMASATARRLGESDVRMKINRIGVTLAAPEVRE
jgi:hypothetical protein